MKFVWFLARMFFGLADRLRMPQLLMRLNTVVKPNTRPMTREEQELARSVFGESIDYQKVRLDTRAFIGCRQFGFAYVGFNVINCWGRLTPQHLIHELVHVWQYQSMGSVYIPLALWAQWFGGGYNYGGIAALQLAAENGKQLADFNLEQQGDIVADYYCLCNGGTPRWCPADTRYLGIFEQVIKFT